MPAASWPYPTLPFIQATTRRSSAIATGAPSKIAALLLRIAVTMETGPTNGGGAESCWPTKPG